MSEETKNRIKDIIEWILCIVIALIIAIAFRYFIGTPTIVQMPSMRPTLEPDQRLWLNRWGRTTKKLPERGDIITFEAPLREHITLSNEEIQTSPIARYGDDSQKSFWDKFSYYVLEIGKTSYIKRVIGIPGDHVEIKDGKVYLNGEVYSEGYLPSGIATDNGKGNCIDIVVPANCVFAMGDNRSQSTDCRSFGCIPLERIESKVWIRIWPLNLFGKIDK